MKTSFFCFLLVGICMFFINCTNKKGETKNNSVANAKQQNKNNLPDSIFYSDANFAVVAAETHLMQIEIAKLCETNASLDTIVKLGRTLVKSHYLTEEELMGWANEKKVSLPDSLTPNNQEKYENLLQLKERKFENKFIEFTIQGHQQLLDSYRQEAERGKDTVLKAWAREKISLMEADLQTANWIKAVLSKPPLKK